MTQLETPAMPSTQPIVEAPATPVQKRAESNIQDAAAWILRIGVVTSVLVMLVGLALALDHGSLTTQMVKHTKFDYRPTVLWHGVVTGNGVAVINLGIYLLVLTPILRVATSMVLFLIEEHDYLYTVVTLLVLILTLAGLLIFG